MSMSKEAKAAAAAYMREYRKKNPERFKRLRESYWERKARERPADNDNDATERSLKA